MPFPVTARAALAAFVLSAVPGSSAPAQQLLPARITPSKIVPARDSFAVHVNGAKRGSWTTVVTREAGNFRYVADLTFDAQKAEHSEIVFDASTAMPVSYASREMSGKDSVLANVSITPEGHTTGMLRIGAWSGRVDTRIPAGAAADAAFSVLLPTIDLAEGVRMTFTSPSWNTQSATVIPFTVAVVGRQKVTVPAGTFDVFQVDLQGPLGQPVSAFITAKAPRRTVLIRSAGGAVEMRLVSTKPK